jgi:phosphatidylinositol alpha-1,6-mannosyltransferase
VRLLLITIDFPPARGGVQYLLAQLAEGLAALRHSITVVAPRSRDTGEQDRGLGYRVRRCPVLGQGKSSVVGVMAVAGLEILARRPDAIICGHVLLGPFCRFVSVVARIPYIAMAYAYEIRAPRMRRIATVALRGAARVVTISEFSRRAVEAHGVRADRVSVIRPGAAIRSRAAGSADGRGTTREASRILLSVGRLVDAYKGHDMVIRALPLVLAKHPDAAYVIVGDGPLRRYLERLAESLGVMASVQFVGQATDAEVSDWYERCHLFVLASRESGVSGGAEGYGIVFIEANLHGKPVVAGRSGGIPDAVIDGHTGILVDPTEVCEIADAIILLLSDEPLSQRLGEQGRRRAIRELSWAGYARQFDLALQAVARR